MNTAILALNAGSSSLKFALYPRAGALLALASGEVQGLGTQARLHAQRDGAAAETQALPDVNDVHAALQVVTEWIMRHFADIHFAAIGHRVVHGGTKYTAPVVVDDAVLRELDALDPLAPLHQPFNLDALRHMQQRFPGARTVACFDTAFHAHWDDRTARLALPRRFHDAGIRRYGFHGLSYEFLTARLRELAPGAQHIVLAHLGSGASICAVQHGRSIDCTMGFSALDGLPMSTRCGALDASVIFHLQRQGIISDEIERMLYHDSGLKGMSGISGDMRELLASPRAEAGQAVAVFTRRCSSAIGALSTQLGAVDALVFSGGIGAHAAAVRESICAQLRLFGIEIDSGANAADEERISAPGTRVPVFALRTDEQLVIARACSALLEALRA